MIAVRRRLAIVFLGILAGAAAQDLPLKPGSVRFAVIGDMGTGGKAQYEVAAQMERYREKTMFDFVLMLGDNIYGGQSPADMNRKFEYPYAPLLDAGVKFYASLGNHDNPNERFYKPFNMGEKRYYSFKKGNAEFFALDSNYMDPQQLEWLTNALHDSNAAWKICFFHHPLYSDGKVPRARYRLAGAPRTDLPGERRQARVIGARTPLRKNQAARRNLLLRAGQLRRVAASQPEAVDRTPRKVSTPIATS